MAIHARVDAPARTAVFKLTAPLSVGELRSGIDRLLVDPRYTREMNAVVILEQGCTEQLTATDVRMLAHHAASIRQPQPCARRMALVTGSDAEFGMGHMYAAWSAALCHEVAVFRSLADAHAWVSADGAERRQTG
jgi:hypothetical protein